MLKLSGGTITIKAKDCQTGSVAQITELGGDYALALNGNHKTLRADTAGCSCRFTAADSQGTAVQQQIINSRPSWT